ncbi:MAG: 4'-phosphopantetheinyl transferase superfamily protein [Gammaproteobacteria bacterium]|nr:4'-phosphopantetheinyl transferase superfamily protein [Gammaproteobacteria bacterium]
MQDLAQQITGLDAAGDCTLLSSAGCRVAVGRVQDHTDALSSPEREQVEGAVASRRAEYSTGRFLAKRALGRLGIDTTAIRSEGRRPIWPEGVVGSITHSRRFAMAVVCQRSQLAGVGVDLERTNRVTERVAPKTMTERELADTGTGWPPFARTANFSAKEAVFKAVNPIVGLMIGFKEVEIVWMEAEAGFSARYIGPNPANAVMERGQGTVFTLADHIGALFWLEP